MSRLYDSLNARHRRDLDVLDDAELATLLRFMNIAAERPEEEIHHFRHLSE